MEAQANIVTSAFLIADPARLAILVSLLDGRARPAGELARVAGVSPQTASSHLRKLVDGELLAVESEGRHRYYRLSSLQVAFALESLAAIETRRPLPPRPRAGMRRLQFARCCYDHLAGRVGVAMTQRMQALGLLAAAPDKRFDVTPSGRAWFSELGVEVDGLTAGRRGVATQCLDSTERQHHLAGPLGAQLMRCLCERGWLRRVAASREIQVTPRGWTGLRERLGIDAAALSAR
ncbi:ArsR/SmtB family transcription factor [Burkholderia sp. ABCPW 111]|uniref:ArsR/SmtB family transcription factor n=1 Tax=Burkholderia sp. ABCPW 111 TaxID=1820025 RepID=UPI0005320824|nr:winged helix-turn-helix domain-containing protein [Burkholderia sp. ABCPW 111]KGR94461.1 bacterial regulatory, arsR family protein [Burkholderia sp. ABCPW 111]